MTYVISDLHGCFEYWEMMLFEIGFTHDDEIYVLGDIVDRGNEPVRLLFDMLTRPNVFPILGNHEFSLLDVVRKLPFDADINNFMEHLEEDTLTSLAMWVCDGGRVTLQQYLDLKKQGREIILDYLREFELYDEITVNDKEFVLTHSGLMNFSSERELASYSCGEYLFDRPAFNKKFYEYKTIIFGHSPTFIYPENPEKGRILHGETYINIDCGCVFREQGGRLGCLRLDDFKEFYV